MPTQITRRKFLKLSGAALTGLWLSQSPVRAVCSPAKSHSSPPPAPLGRIATWWQQAVRVEPDPEADTVTLKKRDELIPLYAQVVGQAPWPSNPIWYQTEGGFIHSGYVQPVHDAPQGDVVAEVADPGFWGEICVPIAEARWRPSSTYVSYKLYYGTVYRVVKAQADDAGQWWYQLNEGVTWSPGPWVPAQTVRYISPEALAPISLGHPHKWIQINLEEQTLTCLEEDIVIFSTRVSSGSGGTRTPRGEFHVLHKHHAQRMIGPGYDLPGIAFPVYFTWSGVAIHGTYWHNDYGQPHSHGCINVTNDAARWVFRWAEPPLDYGDNNNRQRAVREGGTRVLVV